MTSELNPLNIAAALENSDWSGVSIGNKALLRGAIEILRSISRAVPDVPELVRYDPDECDRLGTCSKMIPVSDGDYVPHDQHVAVIAALRQELRVYMNSAEAHMVNCLRATDRAEAAEAKLAQIEEQEVVGWLHIHQDFNTEFSKKRLTGADFDRGFREEAVYTAPVASAADLKRKVIEEILTEIQDMHLKRKLEPIYNDIKLWEHGWTDAVSGALRRIAALNPSEPRT